MIEPKPRWNDSTSSTVMGLLAGTVSSRPDSGVRRTRGSASSGSQRATGSPSAIAPSSMSSIAATPAIGLVIDAIRKMASRPMGSGSPRALCPVAETCSSRPRATSATSPGTSPCSTCRASAASSAAVPSAVSPFVMRLLPLRLPWLAPSVARAFRGSRLPWLAPSVARAFRGSRLPWLAPSVARAFRGSRLPWADVRGRRDSSLSSGRVLSEPPGRESGSGRPAATGGRPRWPARAGRIPPGPAGRRTARSPGGGGRPR